MQCTYNVTVIYVRVTTVATEKQYVLQNPSVYLYLYVSSIQWAWVILSFVACPALKYTRTIHIIS
jgi:hypothetical protein